MHIDFDAVRQRNEVRNEGLRQIKALLEDDLDHMAHQLEEICNYFMGLSRKVSSLDSEGRSAIYGVDSCAMEINRRLSDLREYLYHTSTSCYNLRMLQELAAK